MRALLTFMPCYFDDQVWFYLGTRPHCSSLSCEHHSLSSTSMEMPGDDIPVTVYRDRSHRLDIKHVLCTHLRLEVETGVVL